MNIEKTNLINKLKTKEPYFEIKTLLANCTHKQQVKFALLAAKSAGEFYDKSEYPKINSSRLKVFKLVEKWLENPKSVIKKELNEAARAAGATAAYAANAAYAAAYVANAAANAVAYAAADMAYVARAAANAANAAYAASDAANAAAYAANAAYAAAYVANAAANAADASDNTANMTRNKHLEFLLLELIKLIAADKGYKISALEVLYSNIKSLAYN